MDAAHVELDAETDHAELVCEPYDERNPACRFDPRVCTEGHADCKCPSPPDVENPACWATMPCPSVPDPRVRACAVTFPASLITGRVIRGETANGRTVITVGVGAKQGLTVRWRGTLVRGDTEEALPGGELTIVRVDGHRTVATVSLALETVRANPRVRFEP